MNRGSSVATKAAHSANGSLDVRLLLNALIAFKQGDFSVRLPVDWTGVEGKIADNFNDAVATSEQMARELERVGRVVGKEGKINQRASVKDAEGARAGQVEALNALIGDLVWPTSEMARVTVCPGRSRPDSNGVVCGRSGISWALTCNVLTLPQLACPSTSTFLRHCK